MDITARRVKCLSFTPWGKTTLRKVLKCAQEMFPGAEVLGSMDIGKAGKVSAKGYITFFAKNGCRVKFEIRTHVVFDEPDAESGNVFFAVRLIDRYYSDRQEWTIRNSDDLYNAITATMEESEALT